MKNNSNNLEIKRHSLAHVLAMAIKKLWPKAQLAIGPAIDNGFYYDVDFGADKIVEADLAKIQDLMVEILGQDLEFKYSTVKSSTALKSAEKAGDIYKAELISDLIIAGEEEVGFYTLGDFSDLCRGPHVDNLKQIDPKGFKLHKLAGAYWRGSEKNKMLTRIYGLAFNDRKELVKYLNLLEEAEKRDHRKLGKELDLFHIDEQVGLGLPLWHPKGAIIWHEIEKFWYDAHFKNHYKLVRTPHIGHRNLWETSGHWGFYNSSMYPPLEVGQTLEERQQKKIAEISEEYLLKPMNCPFHVEIYNHSLRSYRDLPIRYAECGTVYRFEKKGELSGLVRVRGFTQDDAHIICREDQVEEELKKTIDFILFIYKSFGFSEDSVNVYLSLRDPKNKDKYAGLDAGWDFTENILRKVAIEKKLNFKEELGEAAFYGPKLDFKIKDVLGREWQCSTLQFDFNLPDRFDMNYTNSSGQAERPYMLHRALLGSFERFIGLLIEHYAGVFPLWLSPTQIKIIAVGEKHYEYVNKLAEDFIAQGLRVETDVNDETVGNKIRKATMEKIPYMLVVGDKEMESQDLAVRRRGDKETVNMSREELISEIQDKMAKNE